MPHACRMFCVTLRLAPISPFVSPLIMIEQVCRSLTGGRASPHAVSRQHRQWITSGVWPDLGLIGQVDFLPLLAPISAILLWLVTFGLGEEIGWRGFAMPRLLQHTEPIRASLHSGIYRTSSTSHRIRQWGGRACRCWG
ncbi:CPBP family intramembrane glutamic endopeptidase [Candidatus Oscillochloris fontis]|uniref:CPBP family intramembrane glutamic endopeptidase n=1 Tax=Candidatus Oscillochloris fontis TaxID=2496868 RepID=UPI003B82D33D